MEEDKKKPMKNLVFDLRWHDAIQTLPQYEQLEMYEAICRYAKDGVVLDTNDPMKRMALSMIYDRIDEQRQSMHSSEE